jgi:hypothetical protein
MRLIGILTPLAVVFTAACSGPSPFQDPSGSPTTAGETRDAVRVSLTLHGSPLSGAPSWATAEVENLGPMAVRWAGGGCDDPVSITIDFREAFDPGRDWPGLPGRFKNLALEFENPASGRYNEQSRIRGPGQIPVVCTADLRVNELPPGAALTMRAGWDGTVGGAAPAPTGPANVRASFPFIGIAGVVDNSVIDTRPIVVRISTEIVGEGRAAPLSPALAIDAALADQQFADWVQAGPEATWINPTVRLAQGAWAIGLFRNGQGAQGEAGFGEVTIDSSGRVVGRRFEP